MTLLGIPFIAVSPDREGQEVDEIPWPNESPATLVQRLSRAKAEAVIYHLPAYIAELEPHKTYIVIAADTVVVANNKILGKPTGPAEATYMLKLLRQQPHYVYSGLTVTHTTYPTREYVFTTRLHLSQVGMRFYSDAEIAAYVAAGSPLDKAGAYGIQDQPFAPVEWLAGCFTSVMGLPLAELVGLLQQVGLAPPEIGPLCSHHIGVTCCQLANIPAQTF